jgi:hypothetical protein
MPEMRRVLCFMTSMAALVLFIDAELPASLDDLMGKMEDEEYVLCVKNYQAGASITELYTDFESLDKNTMVVSSSGGNNSSNAFLQANLNSFVVGNARLVWQSINLIPELSGRHSMISRNEENLTGIFSIERFILLAFNSTSGGYSGWLPCS